MVEDPGIVEAERPSVGAAWLGQFIKGSRRIRRMKGQPLGRGQYTRVVGP